MTIGAIAEDWTRIYTAFESINFKSYDYDSVKTALLDYLKQNYPENFNDYIESSEMVMLIELFAYVAEQLAFRADMLSHENFIGTAERKQSILRLAKLISYAPKRCISASGFVKLDSITTTEDLKDAHGNILKNKVIRWNDPNNPFWKDQFIQVMNQVCSSSFGSPIKAITVDSSVYSLYTFNNLLGSIDNNVISSNVTVGSDTFNMEVCSAELDSARGIVEAPHNSYSYYNVVFANDGLGDASAGTGYLLPIKEGLLSRIEYVFSDRIPNRVLELGMNNVNNDDVWINDISQGSATQWTPVESILGMNLYFNTVATSKKYEVETLENDQVRLLFGDGNFAEIPYGTFEFYLRQGIGRAIYIPQTALQGSSYSFKYVSKNNVTETLTLTYSLTESIQNGAEAETVERIRQIAPTTYYAQNRMVNGQDYNTLLLRDQSILKLKSVNRTFAGQPKYIAWNDASGAYQNIKIFGDDLAVFYHVKDSTYSKVESSRTFIDNVLEAQILKIPGISNNMVYRRFNQVGNGVNLREAVSIPRRTFIERTKIDGTARNLQEKTMIQGQLDRHFYGEPDAYVSILDTTLGINRTYAVVDTDVDQKIWDTDTPLVVTNPQATNGYTTINANGSNYQVTQGLTNEFGLRYVPYTVPFHDGWVLQVEAMTGTFNDIRPYLVRETVTVECINENGLAPTFLVTSSRFGQLGELVVGSNTWVEHPEQGYKLSITQTYTTNTAVAGDAIILDVDNTGINQRVFVLKDTSEDVPSAVPAELQSVKLHTIVELNVDVTVPFNPAVWYYTGSAALSDGDFVMLTAQTNPAENGLYRYDAGTSRLTFVPGGVKPYHYTLGGDAYTVYFNINLLGKWVPVFDLNQDWDIKVVRGVDQNVWSITIKDYKIEIFSPSTKFWFNSNAVIIDQNTKHRVRDNVQLLKSNLDAPRNKAIGENKYFDVIDFSYAQSGSIIPSRLEVTPTDFFALSKQRFVSGDSVPNDMHQLLDLLKADDYCYFTVDASTQEETFIPRFTIVPGTSLPIWKFNGSFTNDLYTAGGITYRRRPGREGLDFLWQHFAPSDHLIDPSTSNIIDIYVVTQGYYQNLIDYVSGVTTTSPTPPTSLALKATYSAILQNKMISDTVIMNSGKLKLLFGQKAPMELQARFKVVKNPNTNVSDNQVKVNVATAVNQYFDIANWDFGQTFYATDLISYLHKQLGNSIASVVIVPVYQNNSFGSLFTITPNGDEIFFSSLTVDDVDIVTNLDAATLRQKF